MWKKKVYVYITKELKYKENIFGEEEIADGNFQIRQILKNNALDLIWEKKVFFWGKKVIGKRIERNVREICFEKKGQEK